MEFNNERQQNSQNNNLDHVFSEIVNQFIDWAKQQNIDFRSIRW
jgi:hypothetical protein